MTPSQKVADSLLADETLVHEHPQDLGAEEAFEVAGVEARQMVDDLLARAAARFETPPTAEEADAWLESIRDEASHLFLPSSGAGANGSGGASISPSFGDEDFSKHFESGDALARFANADLEHKHR